MRYAVVRDIQSKWLVLDDTVLGSAPVKSFESERSAYRLAALLNRRDSIAWLILKCGDSRRYRARLAEVQAEIARFVS